MMEYNKYYTDLQQIVDNEGTVKIRDCLEFIGNVGNGFGYGYIKNAQAIYIKKALENGLGIQKAHSLSTIWKFNVALGCTYPVTLQQECWDNCPNVLKDQVSKKFKIPKYM